MNLSTLGKVCLVQDHINAGDEQTFSNTTYHEDDSAFAGYATTYLLLQGQALYRVTPDGRIQMARIPSWTDLEVI